MPIATPEVYAQMLDRAKEHGFAYPAINVTSSQTLNAALRGFADAESDGIIQISTGGADYLSGAAVKDMVTGSIALAHFARSVAVKYPMNVALHTDHCPKDKLDGFMRPLVVLSAERVARGEEPLFQSHMWDGSAVPLAENLSIAAELLDACARARTVMEMEIGVVGGEEDGIVGEINEKLYSTTDDALATAEALGLGAGGDPRGDLLRRGQDERGHRHPVRLHPADRGAHVHALRRRAQGRRGGGRQEGVRPALVRQGGRGRHVQPRRPGVRRSDVGRQAPHLSAPAGHGAPP